MKKIIVLALTLSLCLMSALPAMAAPDMPLIGIVQIVNHDALDAAREGFVRVLAEEGYVDGQSITIDYRNAQGNQDTLASIADYFVGAKADMILAIATPSALAVAGKTETVPILGTAITDYESAKLVESNEHPGYNVSGTTDMNPVAEQIALILRFVPEAKTIGLIYTSSEVNSQLQARMAKEEIEKLGLNYAEVTVNNSNDVQQAVSSIMTKCDVLYIPTDNVLAASMPLVYEASLDAKVPVICGEANMVRAGGHFTLAIDYGKLGEQTGHMAVRILRDGALVSEMPIERLTDMNYYVNKTACDAIGLAVPEDLMMYAEETAPHTVAP